MPDNPTTDRILKYQFSKDYKFVPVFRFVETTEINSEGKLDKVFKIFERNKEISSLNIDANRRKGINYDVTSTRSQFEYSVYVSNKTYNVDENEKLIKQQKRFAALTDKTKKDDNSNKQDDKIKSELNNSSILNIPKLMQDKVPFFRKSYSVFDSLTPYIKCYITTPELKLLDNNKTVKNIQKNYFEIPYNMIKSLDVEFNAAPGVAATFILKLEDPTGIIGNIMVAQLYSLGILKNRDGMPKINVEFGWADKGLKKILQKKDYTRFFSKNFFTEYMITDSDIEFTEKFRQELTLKGHQDQVGIDSINYINGNNFSPYKIIGRSPVESLRVLQYYHYFNKNKDNNYGLSIFKDKSSETSTVEQFLKVGIDLQKNKIDDGENFLIAVCKTDNNLFNQINPQDTKCSPLKESFKPFINRSSFHPYIMFCYVLNKYLSTVKDFYEKRREEVPKIYYLCYYDEKNITGFESEKPIVNFDVYCNSDVKKGVKKNLGFNPIGTDTLIQDDESWSGLLQRFSKLVKLKNNDKKSSEPNLYFEINRFIPTTNNATNSIYNQEFSDVSLNTFATKILIDKFEKLIDFYKKQNQSRNSNIIQKLTSELDKIKERQNLGKTFIYVIITAGSAFLTEDNYPEKPVLQSYTVFPFIQPDNRIEYQNFNSGSRTFLDESYPDVISFRPKINLQPIINANFKTEHSINFNNGIVKFENRNFYLAELKDDQEKKSLTENIKNIISELSIDLTRQKKVDFKPAGDEFYTINSSTIKFFHKELDAYLKKENVDSLNIGRGQTDTKIIELVSSLKNEFDTYADNLKIGYHFSVLNSLIKKSTRVFPGNNNSSDFYSYVNSANEYNKLLALGAKGFEAELKILGEPAFTYDFGPLSYILVKVNNFDGSPNYLLSGLYSLKKMKHTIEGGKFETTLTLMYDSPWGT